MTIRQILLITLEVNFLLFSVQFSINKVLRNLLTFVTEIQYQSYVTAVSISFSSCTSCFGETVLSEAHVNVFVASAL